MPEEQLTNRSGWTERDQSAMESEVNNPRLRRRRPTPIPEQHRLTPTPTPGGEDNIDLLGIETHDPTHQWWDATYMQRSGPDAPSPVQVPSLAASLGQGGVPPSGADTRGAALMYHPPGLDMVGRPQTHGSAGELPQGSIQAFQWPGVTTVAEMPVPDFCAGGPRGMDVPDDSDIYSFLAGARPRISAESVLVAEGQSRPGNAYAEVPSGSRSPTSGRGASPAGAPEHEVSSAVSPRSPTFGRGA